MLKISGTGNWVSNQPRTRSYKGTVRGYAWGHPKLGCKTRRWNDPYNNPPRGCVLKSFRSSAETSNAKSWTYRVKMWKGRKRLWLQRNIIFRYHVHNSWTFRFIHKSNSYTIRKSKIQWHIIIKNNFRSISITRHMVFDTSENLFPTINFRHVYTPTNDLPIVS